MLKAWAAKRREKYQVFQPIEPEQPFYAIGDIHGRSDLLERALLQLPEAAQIVFVGDYIDRGEDSAGVLRRLIGRPNSHFLMGNHEEMLLAFLENPRANGSRWLRYGGLQTLASFGVSNVTETCDPNRLEAVRDALRQAMGPEQIFWLHNLLYQHRNGNVIVVHAGADPKQKIDLQDKHSFIWGHHDFGKVMREDGLWIVHGHTIVSNPVAEKGIISIDTGAYATGQLCVANIFHGGVSFNVVG